MEASVCCLGLAALACGRAVYWGLGILTTFNFDIVCLFDEPLGGAGSVDFNVEGSSAPRRDLSLTEGDSPIR